MSKPIIFYDIPSKLPGNAWSPNTWKTRYALNIKGVPYTTVWVEYPDIEALAIKIGALPTGSKGDGSPSYTLPIIQDPNTGKVVSDSFVIAEYLDATYTGKHTLFPSGTKPLIEAYEAALTSAIGPFMLLQRGQSCDVLNPSSEKYFRETRELRYGMKIEEFSPAGAKRDADLAKGKEGLSTVHGWLSKNGGGKYILGSTVSYADGITGGWINWIRIIQGPDSAVWKSLASHNGGFWGKYLNDLDTYASVQ